LHIKKTDLPKIRLYRVIFFVKIAESFKTGVTKNFGVISEGPSNNSNKINDFRGEPAQDMLSQNGLPLFE